MADETQNTVETYAVKVNFRIPARMPSVYAHSMTLQVAENEAILNFYEVMPPLLIGEQQAEMLADLQETGLNAECVARVTIAKANLPKFADMINEFVAKLGLNLNPAE